MYSSYIALDPFNAPMICNRAIAAAMMGYTKEAIDDASKAIQLAPLYTKAYLLRARCRRVASTVGDRRRNRPMQRRGCRPHAHHTRARRTHCS